VKKFKTFLYDDIIGDNYEPIINEKCEIIEDVTEEQTKETPQQIIMKETPRLNSRLLMTECKNWNYTFTMC